MTTTPSSLCIPSPSAAAPPAPTRRSSLPSPGSIVVARSQRRGKGTPPSTPISLDVVEVAFGPPSTKMSSIESLMASTAIRPLIPVRKHQRERVKAIDAAEGGILTATNRCHRRRCIFFFIRPGVLQALPLPRRQPTPKKSLHNNQLGWGAQQIRRGGLVWGQEDTQMHRVHRSGKMK